MQTSGVKYNGAVVYHIILLFVIFLRSAPSSELDFYSIFYIFILAQVVFMSVHITTTAPSLVCSGKLSVVEPS